MATSEELPAFGAAFDQLLEQIDTELKDAGHAIHSRPMGAWMKVARRFDLPLPLGRPNDMWPKHLSDHWPVTEYIFDWYEHRYGDKLKIDSTLGTIVIELDGDLWSVVVPLLLGKGMFVAMRPGISLGRGAYNILDLVQTMTPAHAETLSANAFSNLQWRFAVGFEALAIMEGTRTNELMRAARKDVQAAVANLTDTRPEFGTSKWASLQVAEKAIKAAIEMSGERFSPVHLLATINAELVAINPAADVSQYIPQIQCTPSIRYGKEPCAREEALAAHYASLQVVCHLYHAGVQFKSTVRRSVTAI